jgi:antitoxin component YwqK of YwqJK toxin-antitoxin module
MKAYVLMLSAVAVVCMGCNVSEKQKVETVKKDSTVEEQTSALKLAPSQNSNKTDGAENQFAGESWKEICSECNKTDSAGRKQGLWVKVVMHYRFEEYYKDGRLSGVFKQFRAGKLSILGEYIDGKEYGTWTYYDNNGKVKMICDGYTQNYDTISREWDSKRYVPDYKCYLKVYHSSGSIEREGWLLYNEGEAAPESDLSIQYGTWKSYNDKGELIGITKYNQNGTFKSYNDEGELIEMKTIDGFKKVDSFSYKDKGERIDMKEYKP